MNNGKKIYNLWYISSIRKLLYIFIASSFCSSVYGQEIPVEANMEMSKWSTGIFLPFSIRAINSFSDLGTGIELSEKYTIKDRFSLGIFASGLIINTTPNSYRLMYGAGGIIEAKIFKSIGVHFRTGYLRLSETTPNNTHPGVIIGGGLKFTYPHDANAPILYEVFILVYREQNNVYYSNGSSRSGDIPSGASNSVVAQIGWKFHFVKKRR